MPPKDRLAPGSEDMVCSGTFVSGAGASVCGTVWTGTGASVCGTVWVGGGRSVPGTFLLEIINEVCDSVSITSDQARGSRWRLGGGA
jgi:hypothetical protein